MAERVMAKPRDILDKLHANLDFTDKSTSQ
jgi:hypothetical protein